MTQEILLKARDLYNKGLNQEAIKTLETLLLDNNTDKKDRVEAYLLGGSALRKENEVIRAINAVLNQLVEQRNDHFQKRLGSVCLFLDIWDECDQCIIDAFIGARLLQAFIGARLLQAAARSI